MTPTEVLKPRRWLRRLSIGAGAAVMFNLAFHAWDEPIRRTLAAAPAQRVDVLTPRVGELVDADRPFASTAWWEQVR